MQTQVDSTDLLHPYTTAIVALPALQAASLDTTVAVSIIDSVTRSPTGRYL